jgi:hypothetical protein
MFDSSVRISSTMQKQETTKARKPYHTPKLENYGAVSELTRSGPTDIFSDFATGYSSIPL